MIDTMNAKFPKISIVTPSFNQGEYLEQTINSVLNQQYPNLEYIVIDGGSTDNSVEIIKKYESHLSYWVSEKDGGLYHAVQKGFDKSTGSIMAWINSDDMYHNRCLFAVAQIFSQFSNVHWIMGKNTFFDEASTCFVYGPDPYNERWSIWRLYNFNSIHYIQQESTFWRRELWNKVGSCMKKELRLAGDFDLWLRFFQHEKLYSTNVLLAGFRQRSKNQKSKESIKEYIKEAKTLIQKDLSNKNRKPYFCFLKFALRISKVIPFKKIRVVLTKRLLSLPPIIEYSPNKDFFLNKKN
jgi:glycosyltransferase involved in cell wall biosynthesis